MQILDHKAIRQKITRLSYEVLESHFNTDDIHLIGINNNGLRFASILKASLESLSDKNIHLNNIKLNPAEPLSSPIELDVNQKGIENQAVIIVDDVANTGRTLFYAFKPFFETIVSSLEVAVLVDRKHKTFPVKVDYVGLSLATTVKQNIKVFLEGMQYRVELH